MYLIQLNSDAIQLKFKLYFFILFLEKWTARPGECKIENGEGWEGTQARKKATSKTTRK